MRQIRLQRLPVVAVIVRNEKSAFRANIEQARPHWVFAYAVRIAEHRMRNAISDRFPGLAIVGRFVDERIAIVHLMTIDSEVSRARAISGWFDVADCAP